MGSYPTADASSWARTPNSSYNMRIITHTCPNCGTVVAANELEANRVMKCPGRGCEEVLRFEDLAEADREHFLSHHEQYQI